MDMSDGLTRENPHGIWLALATPFTADDRIDTDALRENVRRCHEVGLHGVYTTDSELAEFKELIDAFADACVRMGMPSQAGATWTNTRGTIDRLQFAAARGVLGAHVGHPTFMPMTDASFMQFWRDVSDAVPDRFGLIEYNTPRQSHVLVGVKHVQREVDTFIASRLAAPELALLRGRGGTDGLRTARRAGQLFLDGGVQPAVHVGVVGRHRERPLGRGGTKEPARA